MNMSIYQIDTAMMQLIDEETGEIKDFEAFEQLALDRDNKIENIGCWIKNLEADAEALKKESDNLTERANAAKKNAEKLKELLAYALHGEKFNSLRCAVTWRKSESVEIEDESLIPKDYMIAKTEYKPNKKLIKAMLKAGTEIPSCKVVQKLNAQIK